jgi:hypothetical protein
MQTTPRRSIVFPNPDRTDQPDVAIHIGNIATAADQSVVYAKGTLVARPGAGMDGRFYIATDLTPHRIYYDDGTTWIEIPPIPSFMNLSGALASRPAASAALVGYRYFAIDSMGEFLCVAGPSWILVNQGRPKIVPSQLSSAPYTSPYDGMEVSMLVDTFFDHYWELRYNTATSSAQKWDFTGGTPLAATQGTGEQVTSGTFADIGSNQPQITIPRTGDYYFEHGHTVDNPGNAGNHSGLSILNVAGVNVGAFCAAYLGGSGSGIQSSTQITDPFISCNAGDVAKLRYRGTNGILAVTYFNRWLTCRPKRIS